MTSLTSQHVLWSHIDCTSVTAAALTGTPPKNTWIAHRPFQHCENEDVDADGDSDCAWEDIPEFEASQEMLADVYNEIEELVVDTVNANWCVSVSC